MPARQPLAWRLALPLAAAVLIVLLIAGVLVNRTVSRSIEDELTSQQEEQLAVTVAVVNETLARDDAFAARGLDRLLRRIAQTVRGEAFVLGPGGELLATAGNVPPGGDPRVLREPLDNGGTLQIALPRGEVPFLRAFNAALIIAGILSVAVIVVIAATMADRLTRPLRGVAAAAGRVGAGDLRARATGGPDRESAELADAFNAMAGRLEQSEMLRRRAASDVAHDLATPATVLESQLQAMVDGVVPADAQQLHKAQAAASSLSSVIGQLGELAGAEAASLQRRPERLDLAAVARDVIAGLDALLRERSVTAVIEGEAVATADRGHVERALRNVVTNAVQHSPPGGEVRVSLTQAARGAAEVRVSDPGTGVAPEDEPHVFERFYRSDPARGRSAPRSNAPDAAMPRRAGSGIGLTIARELLTANGGSISVERTGREGTIFLLRLP